VLAHPATAYVADFVGADRGLRRLAVTPVEVGDLYLPPVVGPSTSLVEAREAVFAEGTSWAVVVDQSGRLLGWVEPERAQVPRAEVDGAGGGRLAGDPGGQVAGERAGRLAGERGGQVAGERGGQVAGERGGQVAGERGGRANGSGGGATVAPFVRPLEARVEVGSSLKVAFAEMLQHDAGWVAVLDGGRYLGVLTPDALHAALRRSVGGVPVSLAPDVP